MPIPLPRLTYAFVSELLGSYTHNQAAILAAIKNERPHNGGPRRMNNEDINLGAISVTRKSGDERLLVDNSPSNFSLLGFWQWSCSDLLNNTLRGRFAEYIVACALGLEEGTRVEWDAVDLTLGDIRIEVKSAAHLQSWRQKALSPISFDIRSTLGWDATTNIQTETRTRQADVYVFCVLIHEDKQTVNPLNLTQWEFYVLPTFAFTSKHSNQKRMSLSTLLTLKPTKCTFSELRNSICREAARGPDVVT